MAKVITYNAGTNTIIAKGGTELDPITFADLYAADQGGGWGVVHYYGQNTYHLDALLYLGDGYTSTYFIDSNKVVVLTDQITGNTTRLIYVSNNAHIQLGKLNSESAKETYDGCMIHMNFDALFTILFEGGYTNTYRRLYGCTVISRNYYNNYCQIYSYDNTRLWNCNFINYVWPNLRHGNPDLYNLTIMSGTDAIRAYGFNAGAGSPVIDDCIGLHLRRLASCYPQSEDIKINKFKALQNEQAVAIQGSHNKDVILTDCELTNWINYMRGVTQTGKVLRKYTVNIHVSDKDGANLSGVNVVCKDKDSNEVFSVNTDVNGDIAEQEVTYQEWYQLSVGWHGEDEATCFSPHSFIISKTGYETLEIDAITLSEPVKWHLELQDPTACDYPVEGDVEKDVVYDSGAKTGNFEAPLEEDVEKGVGYGSQGTEFLGTLEAGLVLAGQNLEGQLEKKTNLSGNLQENVNVVGVLGKADIMIGVLQEKTVMIGKLRKTGIVGEMK